MEPVHEDIAGAKAVDNCGELGGHILAVFVDDKCRFFGVVETLADAHAEESRILAHQVTGYLLLYDDCCAENC